MSQSSAGEKVCAGPVVPSSVPAMTLALPAGEEAASLRLTCEELRARLAEERLGVARLQAELSSVEDLGRIEATELRQRLKVLTHAQQTTRARDRKSVV